MSNTIDMSDIYKLRDWINIDNLNWNDLSFNPNAIPLLEKNMDKINWVYLSHKPNAIHLLEQNIDKINWHYLSQNPNIFVYDYDKMKQNRINSGIIEELIANVFEPNRLHRICEKYNIKFRELIQIYSIY